MARELEIIENPSQDFLLRLLYALPLPPERRIISLTNESVENDFRLAIGFTNGLTPVVYGINVPLKNFLTTSDIKNLDFHISSEKSFTTARNYIKDLTKQGYAIDYAQLEVSSPIREGYKTKIILDKKDKISTLEVVFSELDADAEWFKSWFNALPRK